MLERSKERCLTVGWRSRDLRPLSRDRSATFFKFFSNCLKLLKNVVWQSTDGRVTSTTVAWPFSDFFKNFPKSLETSKKTLFDSRSTVAWPPTTVAWPFSDFFQNFPKLFETSKKRCWRSADGRVTSDHCRVTVQRLFQKISLLLQTSKERCLTVGRRSRDLRPLSRDRSATSVPYFAIFVETSTKLVWKPVKSRLTFRLFCFRGFCERLTHMLGSKCLSRSYLISYHSSSIRSSAKLVIICCFS